jgi:hypothetical protein
MTDIYQGGFLRDSATGALIVAGPGGAGLPAHRSGMWTLFALARKSAALGFAGGGHDRRAEYDPTSNKTFVSYLGPRRGCYVVAYDHTAGTVDGPVKVADYVITFEDDHGVPSLTLDDQGTIHILFGNHNGQPRYCKSNSPRAIGSSSSDWTVTDLTSPQGFGTYHTLVYEPVSGKLYAFFRYGNSHSGSGITSHEDGYLLISSDRGATWSNLHVLDLRTYSADAAKDVYAHGCDVRGGKVHLVWGVAHGASHDGTRSDVYHAYYDPATGHLYNMAGADQGTVIDSLVKLNACKVATVAVGTTVRQHHSNDGKSMLCWMEQKGDGKVGVGIAYWDGSTWTVTDPGLRTNYLYCAAGVRRDDDGTWEVYAPIGRDTETIVTDPAAETVAYLNAGADLGVLTSPDGTTWTNQGRIVRRQDIRGQGVGGVSIPRYSANGVKCLVGAAAMTGFPTDRLPVYALSNEDVDPLRVAMAKEKAPLVEFVEGVTPLVYTTPPGASTYNVLDLSTYVPENCSEVCLAVKVKGKGAAAGFSYVRVRPNGTTRTGDATVSVRKEWPSTDTYVQEVWCQIYDDKKIQWLADPAGVTQVGIDIKGWRLD